MTTRAIGTRERRLAAAVLGVAEWLCLAAAPTFAIMALASVFLGGGPPMVCATGVDTSPLRGMTAMYLLMTAFHAPPWLRLISGLGNARELA